MARDVGDGGGTRYRGRMGARVKIWFDGGARPAGMETAVVIRGVAHVRRDIGPGTSMTAEWLALIDAARIARDAGIVDAVLLGDAAAVVAQANGIVRCPAVHAAHLAAFVALGRPRVRQVKRTQNLAGIALARLHPR